VADLNQQSVSKGGENACREGIGRRNERCVQRGREHGDAYIHGEVAWRQFYEDVARGMKNAPLKIEPKPTTGKQKMYPGPHEVDF